MKKILPLLFLSLFSMQAWSLDTCNGSPKKQGSVFNVKVPKSWNDCEGVYTWRTGETIWTKV